MGMVILLKASKALLMSTRLIVDVNNSVRIVNAYRVDLKKSSMYLIDVSIVQLLYN